MDNNTSADQTAARRVADWLAAFDKALTDGDTAAVQGLFAEDGYWRDFLAFTWNIKTLEGRAAIGEMLGAVEVTARNWAVDGEVTEKNGLTEAWLTFETATACGRARLRLRDAGCWVLLTTAQALKGHEEKRGPTRVPGVEHGAFKDRESWLERRTRERAELGTKTQPYVVIVGGGQGGIALGARLKRLDVPTVILESNDKAGDSWRRRYKSLCLHDPVWYDHLPYIPFPDHWPVFAPKDMIGDWLESYVKIMDLDYWTRSTCGNAAYDPAAGEWTVTVDRDGETMVLKPKHLVMATGMSGVPFVPDLPGMDRFKGDIWHSSKHPGGEGFAGKRAVVIGSNNSAHDICADLWENGAADITMVQRSSTMVARSATLMELDLGPLYSEQAVAKGITTDMADLLVAATPYGALAPSHRAMTDEMKRRDADFYRRLEAAGFLLDFGDDDTGLALKYLRRGSGYYIDVGASELVANGDIKLKAGQVESFTETGAVLADGTELPADLIVLATGYGSMNGWAAQLISQEVADKVGKVWGLGSDTTKDPGPWEGEQRNMWKPTQQEGLWFHGGNLHQSRHYSQVLALQLKARQVGLETPVYGLQPVFHKG